jgi:hypothetical protein
LAVESQPASNGENEDSEDATAEMKREERIKIKRSVADRKRNKWFKNEMK